MSLDCDEDDKLLEEWLSITDNEKNEGITAKGNQETANSSSNGLGRSDNQQNGVPIADIAGPSGSVSFANAFAFLQKDMEKEYKASLPDNTNVKTFALGSGKAIVVNQCQRGNPVLEHIRNVPWQYADKDSGMIPDYILNATTCCLFLSLRYHALKPNYIYDRIQALRRSKQYALRIILGLVDIKEPSHSVKELAKAALISEMTFLLAFSNEECGTYLETFKSHENKPPDLIRTKVKKQFAARLHDTLASVKSINKTDSHLLLSTFESLHNVANATEREMALLPGIGGLKAKRLHDLFHTPFLKEISKEDS